MNLWKVTLRHYTRHPWQILLSIIGISLGVAVVVAIDLANSSAQKAFELSSEALTGRATHQILGGSEGLPENLYVQQRIKSGFRKSAPVVEGYGNLLDERGNNVKKLQIVGIDIFAEQPFRNHLKQTTTKIDLGRFMTGGNTAILLKSTAQKYGLKIDSEFQIQTLGVKHSFILIGLIEARNNLDKLGLDSMLFMDIATAQEVLDMKGKLTKIDLILPRLDEVQLNRQIEKRLPPNSVIVSSQSKNHALKQMTSAFQLNLYALSMLALLVGLFLIYNTMTFSVVQRRHILGYLRTLGVTRKQIFALIFAEAILVSTLATAVGIGLGILLGTVLLSLVTQTINDLYFVLTVNELDVSAYSIVKGMLLGLLGSTFAVMLPAYEATKSTPRSAYTRSVLEANYKKTVSWSFRLGILFELLGAGLFAIPTKSLVLSFIGLFVIIIGFTLLVPQLSLILLKMALPIVRRTFGELGNLAARGVVATFSRTGVAVTSLCVAIATTIGVAVMIDSFRSSVDHWLENTLQADVFIRPAGETGRQGGELSYKWVERFKKLPDVADISLSRRLRVQSSKGVTDLNVYEAPNDRFDTFELIEGGYAETKEAFYEKNAVLISEPYAYRHDLHVGDGLVLTTKRGPKQFVVAGVYVDYGNEQGVVTINRKLYLKYWDDNSISTIGVYAKSDVDVDILVKKLRDVVAEQLANPYKAKLEQDLEIRSNKAIKEASLGVFERTFAVTHVLRMLAITVAFVGVLSALMSILIERSRELALLRALGLTPRQVWWVVSGETSIIGALAGIVSIPLGLLLAYILIHIVNRRSFGWTMDVSVDTFVIAQAVILAITAAIIAGIIPAIQMSRVEPAIALREE